MSAIDGAAAILQCLTPERPELRVTDVARHLAMPKSTVSRLMKVMARSGLLEQDRHSQTYRLGPLVFRLGCLYQAHLKILDLVDDAVAGLVEEFGLTGYVAVLNGADVVILRVRQGWYPVRFVLEQGYRVPAWVTAVGRTLLARLPDEEVRRLHPHTMDYEGTGLRRTVDELFDDLRIVRRQGWAEVQESTFAGFGAVAVAVREVNARQPIGFCLSYPVNAVTDVDHEVLVGRLVSEAARIGEKAGDPYWSRAHAVPVPRPERGAVATTRRGAAAASAVHRRSAPRCA